MGKNLIDLYTDYLISSFSSTTATGLSTLVDGSLSHDQITTFLAESDLDSKSYKECFKIRELLNTMRTR